jgi:hypothetical protein
MRGDSPEVIYAPVDVCWLQTMDIFDSSHVQILPHDAWVALGVVQFATRNPALSAAQRQIIERFDRELRRGLTAIELRLRAYLEMGWNPALDVLSERGIET